ncbi:MAG: hypothetical protein U0869_05015 [Chloroflexota bacterium]
MVRWLSVTEMTEQGFLVDALEMPAYPIVVARITTAELSAVRKVADELKACRDRDEKRFAELAVSIHFRLLRAPGSRASRSSSVIVLGPVPATTASWSTPSTTPSTCSRRCPSSAMRRSGRATRISSQRPSGATARLMHEMAIERVQRPEIARHFRDRGSPGAPRRGFVHHIPC